MLCSKYTATWCQRCGDCTCAKTLDVRDRTQANALRAKLGLPPAPPPLRGEQPCMDKSDCPLHGEKSKHADNQDLARHEGRIGEAAKLQGVELTPHDHRAVSRFAQMLSERARATRGEGEG